MASSFFGRGVLGTSMTITKDKKPFDNQVDFETFFPWDIEVKKEVLDNFEPDTPLNMYKYLLLKMCTDEVFNILAYLDEKEADEIIKDTLKIAKEAKEKYKIFLRRGIPVTAEEKKHLRSAYGIVRLADLIQTANKGTRFAFCKMTGGEIDYPKFKEICSAIIDGSAGAMCIPYLVIVYEIMIYKHYHKLVRFVLCFMTEIIKKDEKIRTAKGILPGSHGLDIMFKNADWMISYRKIICLARMLAISDIFHNLGHIDKYILPIDEDEIEKSLMEVLANCDKTGDEFYKVSMRPQNYDEAKKIYDLILKYIRELLDNTRGRARYVYECKQFKALAHGHFAGFLSDPEEMYKLCKKSNEIITGLHDSKFHMHNPYNPELLQTYFLYGVMDLNYRRMWNIKLDIYKKDKSLTNLNALKKVTDPRIKFGEFLHKNCVDMTSSLWWVNFDMTKCYLQVYQNYKGAREHAELLYKVVQMQPASIPILIRLVSLDPRSMSSSEFAKQLIIKLK